jgi:elongator complex protein 2
MKSWDSLSRAEKIHPISNAVLTCVADQYNQYISLMQPESTATVHCRLAHHGAAAAMSGNQVVSWLRLPKSSDETTNGGNECKVSTTLVYASHANINIALPNTRVRLHNGVEQNVLHVARTLRSSALESLPASTTTIPVITCIATVQLHTEDSCLQASLTIPALVSGFSNGMIQVWMFSSINGTEVWTERTLEVTVALSDDQQHHDAHRSITTLAAIVDDVHDTLWVAAGTSAGATLFQCRLLLDDRQIEIVAVQNLSLQTATLSLLFASLNGHGPAQHLDAPATATSDPIVLFLGTAAPRHNKIHVYMLPQTRPISSKTTTASVAQYSGFLAGHEDWITSLAFSSNLLASSSQDTRIRLWKFQTKTSETPSIPHLVAADNDASLNATDPASDIEDDNPDTDDTDPDEGESRLEILHSNRDYKDATTSTAATATAVVTSVSLEALLYGHEESVTSVAWHPDPEAVYGVDRLLLSSSMDRTVLFWTSSGADGVWTPLTRVGSAGGILGGSMGSTLLGFCSVGVEPTQGRSLIGHAYGGTLHVWELQLPKATLEPLALTKLLPEERATMAHWRASPSLTGHFGGVSDLSWEAAHGDYLLTVSVDQTCRLWSTVARADDSKEQIWIELARPQVHGYDLTAVASLSTISQPHLMVTGADEKELRAFDAPKSTIRALSAISGCERVNSSDQIASSRVERAFIPSLGLSNKASAADAAAEDDGMEGTNKSGAEAIPVERMKLPLERDLGAVSLWPEVQKLFGHNTEIYALASTLGARTGAERFGSDDSESRSEALLASAAKARDVEDAKIRLWNVRTGKCVQVLPGGHKSTVATLCFSSNGRFLASSGKDRRLCVWQRQTGSGDQEQTSFALAAAKEVAHKRIVWSVSFCPMDSSVLASGSRDGCIKVWKIQNTMPGGDQSVSLAVILEFEPLFQRNGKPDAVTALSFAPVACTLNCALLAVGLESGRIELWEIPLSTDNEDRIIAPRPMKSNLDATMGHSARISKLAWRPIQTSDTAKLHLASCSMDHGCRIWDISIAPHS